MSATAGDSAAATYLAVSPADAFEIFTSEVDAWWRHGKAGADFARHLGLWWGDLMSALREHVLTRPSWNRGKMAVLSLAPATIWLEPRCPGATVGQIAKPSHSAS
ncbi:MAG TPA: hypothetical protein VFS67_26025 [Polyangiaceae bacterium]|nr:hypothetical protein [Polyangiaceae bacterium]